VAPERSFDELVAGAAEAPPGSDGLFFLPYLTGERTPHPDPLARGAFVGLTVRHDLRHMTRAVMEGVAFGLRDGLDLMVGAGVDQPTQIRASGGGTRSQLWRQILADVLGAEIAVVGTEEGAAYGAALLAGVGTGWYSSVEEAVDSIIEVEPVARPSSDRPVYDEAHSRFAGLYPALAPTFHAG
jgi:xylulokinase